jgi:tRNA-splicing ligase RtcB (3'-phosphate/5'-hydroxy nucleic acid ligase)
MAKDTYHGPLEKVDDCCYRIPKTYKPGMLVDGMIFANDHLLDAIKNNQAPEQVANVAFLPGIQGASMAMPDIHWGYGFCIGGVAATDPAEGGVISPGGVGYDINCGVRLIRTNLTYRGVKPHIRPLIKELFHTVPAGVGRSGKFKFSATEMKSLLEQGASYVVGRGLGVPRDLAHTEANGRIDGADPDRVSDHAVKRGLEQCGTLGSGNHFMEVQIVDHVFDEDVGKAFGLEKDMVCVMIHSGSRGLGYQVCDDALAAFRNVPAKYGINLPDRQLACAPVDSSEGRHYIATMRAAANFGFCNRQLLMQQAREVFERVFGDSWEDLGMELIYDVAHNIAKYEEHAVNGVKKMVWVHRKGATRAFPAGHPELPSAYRATGQPVIIPGDMGRASWVLVGMPGSMERTFGTTCHGAGRAMSRTASVKEAAGRKIEKELEARGVIAMAQSRRGLAEEQPKAYKNVDDVVEVVHRSGLSQKVARMRPIGVIKG